MNRKLIITADDYGLCRSVNEAIEECLDAGAVRATCVMTNMPACDSAALLRKSFPHRSLGIHWNLTQGRPVLDPSWISSLVADDGQFLSPVQFRRRWLAKRIRASEVKQELHAQYLRFRAIAGQPNFWNTHQNVHVFPRLFQLFVAFGRELEIPAMRSHRRMTIPNHDMPVTYNLKNPTYWLKGLVIASWSKKAETLGTSMPDARLYTPGYNGHSAMSLEEIVSRLRWDTIKRAVEFVVHPAVSVNNELFGSLTQSRVLEYETLRDSSIAERLSRRGVELASFDAVH